MNENNKAWLITLSFLFLCIWIIAICEMLTPTIVKTQEELINKTRLECYRTQYINGNDPNDCNAIR